MANVLLNALASTAGGGLTYLRNVLPRLSHSHEHQYYVLTPPEQSENYRRLAGPCLKIEKVSVSSGTWARIWWEQTRLRDFIETWQIDVLVSLGNFALLTSAIPQILFNRNALYFSPEFARDLQARGEYSAWLNHQVKSWLARLSIKTADINVAPSAALLNQLQALLGSQPPQFAVLPFGFDQQQFTADSQPLAAQITDKLNFQPNCRRLLYVSHYNYFRNFETLLRALPELKRTLRERAGLQLQLVLTTELKQGAIYGGYDASAASSLIDQLGVRADIAMLGGVPYEQLHQLYQLCDAYVCPSYAESFGHPLVEAMASGLPVATADLPVHQEICGTAALYFDVFDARALAEQCTRLLTDIRLCAVLVERGRRRAQEFSWDKHCQQLTALIRDCVT
ncbi:MAG: glycosyltransferase family 4 protein [Acidobacteria bacterium]|nr:glycosyltransferase family 4 protein [Acidobacteriota bacterium]MBI3428050.1 glycosyltransferase family 4 protein [Acidobacteriota bacterium]